MFESPFRESLLSKAQDKGIVEIRAHDLREYTLDKHGRVDDTPYGGGVGMVMNIEPIDRALEAVKKDRPKAHSILLSPGGYRFDQKKAWELSCKDEIILVCGRYEGVDQRVTELVDEELSIGDYVLNGGEVAAMVVVEAVARLVPGVVGDEQSLAEESFSNEMLEYPQYTRPRDYKGLVVPEVLVSGDHKKIEDWKRQAALKKTAKYRPDLYGKMNLDGSE
ncbi:MAG: tRNA (guanosine(37)-N1)-methyltransferase TrmD [Nitrospinota bacterium]|nr:tRNA (guanosine(37)-N1)-methyltransferase TrmD [Nitrospinota bacterium]